MKVLFLPAWYPHRRDAMCGLFVRKHAQAVARYAEVCVLYIQNEPGLERMCYEERHNGRLTEYYVYYPAVSRGGKLLRLWRYIRAYVSGLKRVFGQWGRPAVVHVQVLTRNAVAAYLLKLRYGIPYVITEHWTRYMLGTFTGFWHRKLTAFVVKHAAAVMPVSEALGVDMRRCGLLHPNYQVVRNVVDDFFFADAPKPNPHRIVHVCCFAEAQKNNFGLLRAVAALKRKRSDFTLYMVGGGKDWDATRAYAAELGLQDVAVFTGEVTPQDVHTHLTEASFSVFFSRYETASVVVTESLSAGRPVVCTDIPAIAEIMDGHTGRMVPVEDEAALTDALDWMLDHADTFDPAALQRQARPLFASEYTGQRFMEIYQTAVSH